MKKEVPRKILFKNNRKSLSIDIQDSLSISFRGEDIYVKGNDIYIEIRYECLFTKENSSRIKKIMNENLYMLKESFFSNIIKVWETNYEDFLLNNNDKTLLKFNEIMKKSEDTIFSLEKKENI